MSFKNIYLLFIFGVFANYAISQNPKIDSILNLLPNQEGDEKVQSYLNITELYQSKNKEKAFENAKLALHEAKKNKNSKLRAKAYAFVAREYQTINFDDFALSYIDSATQEAKRIKDLESEAFALNIKGVYYFRLLKLDTAAACYQRALEINLEIGNVTGAAKTSNNLGLVFGRLKQYENALTYYKKAIEGYRKSNDKKNEAGTLNNMGILAKKLKKFDDAVVFYNQAYKIHEKSGDKRGQALILMNLGQLYSDLKDFKKALECLDKSLAIKQEINEKKSLVNTFCAIADVLTYKKDYKNAYLNLQKAKAISDEFKDLDTRNIVSQSFYTYYKETKDYEKAIEYQNIITAIQDSIASGNVNEKIAQLQTRYETYKRDREIEFLNQQQNIQTLKLEKQRTTLFAFVAVILLLSVLVLVIFKNYRQKNSDNKLLTQKNEEIKTQKEEIESQKEEIETQHNLLLAQTKNITDSIFYAKKIQTAVLPDQHILNEILSEYFILYKPRNIVSGDFYWIKQLGNKIIICIADCTGHGVPGAFMSMMGVAFMNEIFAQKNQDELTPGFVLNQMRLKIKQSLQQTGKTDEQKDGMDMAFCMIDKQTRQIMFAGANNPLYIIRQTNPNEIYEIKPDHQPIGIYVRERNFETRYDNLLSGDTIYLFSDGYVSQFGGATDETFKTRRFKQLLLDINTKSLNEQHKILDTTIEQWRSTREQTDDILVFGMRLSN